MDHIKDIYIGTYTRTEGHVDGKAEGIYRGKTQVDKGIIKNIETMADIENPSYLALSKDKNFLYAVSELARPNEPTGFVYAYKINQDSTLTNISKLKTYGQAPCHVSMDDSEKLLFVSNYVGGNLAVYNRKEDGTLLLFDTIRVEGGSTHPRQEAPHLHSAKTSRDNGKLMVADLGSDKIWLFDLNLDSIKRNNSNAASIKLKPGDGPRHFDISKDDQYVYVLNELSNTIAVVHKNDKSEYNIIQRITTLPQNFANNNHPADIHIHPNGNYVYASNRGHNSIAIFERNPDTGKLIIKDYVDVRGQQPRNFMISDNGSFLYVANQDTDNIVTFSIDQASGTLTYVSEVKVKTPVCLVR